MPLQGSSQHFYKEPKRNRNRETGHGSDEDIFVYLSVIRLLSISETQNRLGGEQETDSGKLIYQNEG